MFKSAANLSLDKLSDSEILGLLNETPNSIKNKINDKSFDALCSQGRWAAIDYIASQFHDEQFSELYGQSLTRAIQANNFEATFAALALLDAGAKLTFLDENSVNYAIHLAALNGNEKIINKILEMDEKQLCQRTRGAGHKKTFMELLAEKGYWRLVKEVAEKYSDENGAAYYGLVLLYAIKANNSEATLAALALLDAGAKLWWVGPIHLAALNGNEKIINKILEKDEEQLCKTTDEYEKTFMELLAERGHWRLVKEFAEKHSDGNGKAHYGSALNKAIGADNEEATFAALALLDAGAKLSDRDLNSVDELKLQKLAEQAVLSNKEKSLIGFFDNARFVKNIAGTNIFRKLEQRLRAKGIWPKLTEFFSSQALYRNAGTKEPYIGKKELMGTLAILPPSAEKVRFIIDMLNNKDSIFWYQQGFTKPKLTDGSRIVLLQSISKNITKIKNDDFLSILDGLKCLIEGYKAEINGNAEAKSAFDQAVETLKTCAITDKDDNYNDEKLKIINEEIGGKPQEISVSNNNNQNSVTTLVNNFLWKNTEDKWIKNHNANNANNDNDHMSIYSL